MFMLNLFQRAVKAVSLLAQKNSVENLNKIKVIQNLDGITYSSTNLETYVSITLPIWSNASGSYLIDTKALLKSGKYIATEIKPDWVNFGDVGFAITDTNEFTEFPHINTKKRVWEVDNIQANKIAMMGKRLTGYLSDGLDGRTALCYICLKNKYAYATNGHYVLKESHELNIPIGSTLLVPKEFFNVLELLFPTRTEISFYTIKYKNRDNVLIAKENNTFVATRLAPEVYPIVDKVIPDSFDTEIIVDTLETIKAISKSIKYITADNLNSIITISKDKSEHLLQIKAISEGSSFEMSIACKYSKIKLWNSTSINAKQFLKILHDCNTQKICIKLQSDPLKAIVFTSSDNSQTFLLMPFRKYKDKDEN